MACRVWSTLAGCPRLTCGVVESHKAANPTVGRRVSDHRGSTGAEAIRIALSSTGTHRHPARACSAEPGSPPWPRGRCATAGGGGGPVPRTCVLPARTIWLFRHAARSNRTSGRGWGRSIPGAWGWRWRGTGPRKPSAASRAHRSRCAFPMERSGSCSGFASKGSPGAWADLAVPTRDSVGLCRRSEVEGGPACLQELRGSESAGGRGACWPGAPPTESVPPSRPGKKHQSHEPA